jgi:hypothetical protein
MGRFEDCCARLRPLEEMESCDRLVQADAGLIVPGALAALAVRRLSLTGRMLMASATAALGTANTRKALTCSCARAAHLLESWWRSARRSGSARPPRWVTDAHQTAGVTTRISEFEDLAKCAGRPLAMAGNAGLRRLSDVHAATIELLRAAGRSERSPRQFISRVRRFPNPACSRGPRKDENGEPYTLLDMGDAVRSMADLASSARTSILLRCGAELLGFAVRDPEPLLRLLADLPRPDGYHRRGAAVALGAIGYRPSIYDVMVDEFDVQGLEAYALALGVGPWNPDERAAFLEDLVGSVTSVCQERLEELVERADAGCTVTIAA